MRNDRPTPGAPPLTPIPLFLNFEACCPEELQIVIVQDMHRWANSDDPDEYNLTDVEAVEEMDEETRDAFAGWAYRYWRASFFEGAKREEIRADAEALRSEWEL